MLIGVSSRERGVDLAISHKYSRLIVAVPDKGFAIPSTVKEQGRRRNEAWPRVKVGAAGWFWNDRERN